MLNKINKILENEKLKKEIKEEVFEFLRSKGIKSKFFLDETGISPTEFYKAKRNEKNFNIAELEKIKKFIEKY